MPSSWRNWLSRHSTSRAKPASPPSATFQVLSDLHLEHGEQYRSFDFAARAPYLILAGDIGRIVTDYDGYRAFIAAQTSRFELVFLVLGNHEFYGSSRADGLAAAHRLEKESELSGKLVLLHRRAFELPSDPNRHSSDAQGQPIMLLGCTLWSDIQPAAEPHLFKVNDFERIENWKPRDHSASHVEERQWLQDQLTAVRATHKTLVITHYAPTLRGTSHPKHAGGQLESLFATELLRGRDGRRWRRAQTWIFGHTHYTTDARVNGVRIISNARGYAWEKQDSQEPPHRFDEERTIQI